MKIRIPHNPFAGICDSFFWCHFARGITANKVIILSAVGFRIKTLGYAAFFVICFGSAVDTCSKFDFSRSENVIRPSF